jgi:hypothetical protein
VSSINLILLPLLTKAAVSLQARGKARKGGDFAPLGCEERGWGEVFSELLELTFDELL